MGVLPLNEHSSMPHMISYCIMRVSVLVEGSLEHGISNFIKIHKMLLMSRLKHIRVGQRTLFLWLGIYVKYVNDEKILL